LLARQKKLFAKKVDDIWYTTEYALKNYITKQEVLKSNGRRKDYEPEYLKKPGNLPKQLNNYGSYFLQKFPESSRDEVLISKEKFVPSKFFLESVAISIMFFVSVSAGIATLERTAPLVSNQLSAASEFAQISFFDFLSGAYKTLTRGVSNLKQIALERVSPTPRVPAESEFSSLNPLYGGSHDKKIPNSASTTTRTAITQQSVELDLGTYKSELKSELEKYLEERLTTYYQQPTTVINQYLNPIELRREILLADTRPVITRQSDAEGSRRSSTISSLTDSTYRLLHKRLQWNSHQLHLHQCHWLCSHHYYLLCQHLYHRFSKHHRQCKRRRLTYSLRINRYRRPALIYQSTHSGSRLLSLMAIWHF